MLVCNYIKKNKRKSYEGQPRKHLDENRKIISSILKNGKVRWTLEVVICLICLFVAGV